jgi:ketosteroid isomerase-like protein
MKHCPACRSVYTDDTLSFCLQDGTPLEGDLNQSSIDTVAFSNPVTAEKLFNTEQVRNIRQSERPRTHAWNEPPRSILRNPPARKRSNKLAYAVIIGVPSLLLCAAAGVGGWLYKENQKQQHTAKKVESETVQRQVPDTSGEQPAADSVKAQHISDSQPTETESAKKAIVDTIDAWKQAGESRDAKAYADLYAPKADYLGNADATPVFIRKEIAKTFELYDEVEIELTNLKIAIDESHNTATAVFDKEWSFEAKDKLVDGKAHFKLHLQSIDGTWKIVAETKIRDYFNEG